MWSKLVSFGFLVVVLGIAFGFSLAAFRPRDKAEAPQPAVVIEGVPPTPKGVAPQRGEGVGVVSESPKGRIFNNLEYRNNYSRFGIDGK